MLVLAMLLFIGLTLNAPGWYWWCWVIALGISLIKFAFSMFEAGSK